MSDTPKIIIVGGGLAGLAAAAALGGAGYQVDLFEARAFLGGRATSWPISAADENSEVIDNCQHVLLRCCVNLLDFYGRLGVAGDIHFYRDFYFLEPGGRVSMLRRGHLPAPMHFASSFLKMRCLAIADKMAIGRAMLAIQRERSVRTDLDRITMLQWLQEKKQPARAIDRFWRQVLVSAVNEDVDRMAALHGFQVFWLGMLARSDAYEMGVPDVPLRALYRADAWNKIGPVAIHERSPVSGIEISGEDAVSARTADGTHTAQYYICAVPFERLSQVAPGLGVDTSAFEHSPITGIHLWFDRAITDLPHATLLDRTIQWMFNKSGGKYVQVVVSASRQLIPMGRAEIIEMAVRELAEFFPLAREAKLDHAQVIKEVRATYSARPGMEAIRPAAATGIRNLFLAGDWTASGWPATMEGAVRSGYLAAEAVSRAAGHPARFLLTDIA